MESVDDVRGDTSAGRHIVTIATCPFADRGALLTVDGTAAATCTPATTPAATHPTARLDPFLQIVAQFGGILTRKVDLIGDAIEPEFHSFVSCALTVEIIDEGDGHFLSH